MGSCYRGQLDPTEEHTRECNEVQRGGAHNAWSAKDEGNGTPMSAQLNTLQYNADPNFAPVGFCSFSFQLACIPSLSSCGTVTTDERALHQGHCSTSDLSRQTSRQASTRRVTIPGMRSVPANQGGENQPPGKHSVPASEHASNY